MQPIEDGSAQYPVTILVAAEVELATAAPVPSIVSVAAPAASSPMHVYFQQFAGCRHGIMAPAPATAPPDAPIMDLRSAVPPQGQCQYLDMECQHMAYNSADSSGCTGAESSDDGSSFIDDEPSEYTVADALFIATYLQKEMPLTAAQLLIEAQNGFTSSPLKRSRPIILSSDSDSDVYLPMVGHLKPHTSIVTPHIISQCTLHLTLFTSRLTSRSFHVCRLTALMLRTPLFPVRICIVRLILSMRIIMPTCTRLEITLQSSCQVVSLPGVIYTDSDARFAPHTWHLTPQVVGQGSRSKTRTAASIGQWVAVTCCVIIYLRGVDSSMAWRAMGLKTAAHSYGQNRRR